MGEISLAHGGGGSVMREFIKRDVLKRYSNPVLNRLADSAVIMLGKRGRLAFTTDSFVVKPLVFKGGDIGKLAVCGTVNDLAVSGALPLYISSSLIIEEGFSEGLLAGIMDSMKSEARLAGVKIVAGDTKVVERGSCDGIFINTSGIGEVTYSRELAPERIKAGDKIVINGPIADHGVAVLLARENLGFKSSIRSDCASLNRLISAVLDKCGNVRFMRDPTRGGIAAAMNEIAEGMPFGVRLFEKDIPINRPTESACEILGIDPLNVGNEGKVVMVMPAEEAAMAVAIMRRDKLGKKAAVIGEISRDYKGRVVLSTRVGGERIVDVPTLESLPRIC